MKVGFQGEAGAFSEAAIRRLFSDAESVPCPTVSEVFASVEAGRIEFGVVPLENSYAGSINETYDLLMSHQVQIVAETILRVSHCLLAVPDVRAADVRTVYSHAQALEQCSRFLSSIGTRRIALDDTAGAARFVAEERPRDAAAIASREAAEIYGLSIVAADIEDSPDNSTKFVVITTGSSNAFGAADKTSIVFATADVAGALHKCLGEFADRRINLSKLESRPSRTETWQYHFYLDFDAPLSGAAAADAVEALRTHTTFVKVLGSYPRAVGPA